MRTIAQLKTGPAGPTGPAGADGADGADGAAGPGVAAGGTTGQVLAKTSGTDYDTEWTDAGGGGSDPWTTVQLATDFSSTNTILSPDAVTGWTFTPAADTVYLVEYHALGKAASTATGIRLGRAAGLGGTVECGLRQVVPNGATGYFFQNIWGTANISGSASASPSATPHYICAHGMLIAGPTPSGSLQITLATETGGSAVTLLAGSIFRYREVS